jgi:hypothetical protein
MEGGNRWETEGPWTGDDLETAPFIDRANPTGEPPPPPPSFAKRVGNQLFGLFIAITIGAYSGLVSITMQEAWINASAFIGEALVCACVAGIIQSPSLKKPVFWIGIYFAISAVVTPIACYFGLQTTLG